METESERQRQCGRETQRVRQTVWVNQCEIKRHDMKTGTGTQGETQRETDTGTDSRSAHLSQAMPHNPPNQN